MSEAVGLHSSKTPKKSEAALKVSAQGSKHSQLPSCTYQRTEVGVGEDVAIVGVQEGIAMDTQLKKRH